MHTSAPAHGSSSSGSGMRPRGVGRRRQQGGGRVACLLLLSLVALLAVLVPRAAAEGGAVVARPADDAGAIDPRQPHQARELAAAPVAAAAAAGDAAAAEPEAAAAEEEEGEEDEMDLIAEAQEELTRDTALVSTVAADLERLQALYKKLFEPAAVPAAAAAAGAAAGKGKEDEQQQHQLGKEDRQQLQAEILRIQSGLSTLMSHLNETQRDLDEAHEAMEQKATLEDLEELVKQGKVGVNYETGELAAPEALGNLTALAEAVAAAEGAESSGGGSGGEKKAGATAAGAGGAGAAGGKKEHGGHGHGHHHHHHKGAESDDPEAVAAAAAAKRAHAQQEVAAAVSKIQQAADPAMLHLDVELLQDIVLLSVATALGGFTATILRLPAATGYMAAGMLIGPTGLNLVQNVVQVETLAQFGSIFLLFGHGLMYCQQHHIAQLGGALSDTFAAGVLILSAIFFLTILVFTCAVGGAQFYQATLVASAVSLSSTTTTAHALAGSRLRETAYGKTLIELMAVQDLLMAPLLSIPTAVKELLFQHGVYMLPILGLYGSAIAAAAFLSKRFVPKIINLRSRSENSLSLDLFILGIVSYCLLMSLLTEWMGLSHEAGALLAGLVLADVPNISKASQVIEPLTCLFGGMYLGSLGMILSPVFLLNHAGVILACVLVVMAIKVAAVGLGLRALGFSTRAALAGGLSLAQISELSLFLVARAHSYRLISRRTYLLVVATTIVLLMLTPVSAHALTNTDRGAFRVGSAKPPALLARWWPVPLGYDDHHHHFSSKSSSGDESERVEGYEEDGDGGALTKCRRAAANATMVHKGGFGGGSGSGSERGGPGGSGASAAGATGKSVTHRVGLRSMEQDELLMDVP